MTDIRNNRSGRQRRRAGATLLLAAASCGLLAAAPTALADNPYADIVNDVQSSVALGQADYTAAATDFSTAGDTNEGLLAAFAGTDDIFLAPQYYTALGLTAAATGTNFSGFSSYFVADGAFGSTTASGEQAEATTLFSLGTTDFSEASTALSGGEYFIAAQDYLAGSYVDILGGQAETLAGLFSLGI